jgi:hypothetical protein
VPLYVDDTKAGPVFRGLRLPDIVMLEIVPAACTGAAGIVIPIIEKRIAMMRSMLRLECFALIIFVCIHLH